MKKKLIIIILLAVITIGLVGCGSSSTTTSSTSSSTTQKKCKFKNSDGSQTCNNPATHGDLCDYHYNYLNGVYNSYTK